MNAGHMLKDDFQFTTENLELSIIFRLFFKIKRLSFKLKKNSLARPFEKKIKKDRFTKGIENPDALCIEISSEKINMLLEQRLICAADIRCLNTNSKQCLKKLCLKTCLYNTPPYISASQLLDNSKLTNSTLQMEHHES